MKPLVALALLFATFATPASTHKPLVVVGSKVFTESVILGDIAVELARRAGAEVGERRELGGTRVLWDALCRGDIDVYAEYTGTLAREVFAGQHVADTRAALGKALAAEGILMGPPIGFSDNYALAMRAGEANKLGIKTIGDLARHPQLRFGFSNEFMSRSDGWPGLRDAYHLPHTRVIGMEHALAYRALAGDSIQVTDVYTTDANIAYYHLVVLADSKRFFPAYQAVYLYRADLVKRAPEVVHALRSFRNRIDVATMRRLNAAVKLKGESDRAVAAHFLGLKPPGEPALWSRLALRTWQHLYLVALSLAAAIVVAIPLGIAAARFRILGQVILSVVGILQTLPSLALLVLMIPLLGIGAPPALFALFLYSLLPIVRNTHAGLRQIDATLLLSARALGLPSCARLRLVELPLALPSILAGIKTAAVINVGTATLAALIGAGGYGQPILTGIRLNSIPLILEGAVPAALLALLVQGLFELAERYVSPRALRRRGRPQSV